MRLHFTIIRDQKSIYVIAFLFFVLVSIVLSACLEDDLDRLNFSSNVFLENPRVEFDTALILRGEISMLKEDTIVEKGFYWSDSIQNLLPLDTAKVFKKIFTNTEMTNSEIFEHEIGNLRPGITYHFLAYAAIKNISVSESRSIFSEIRSHTFGVVVKLKGQAQIVNDSAIVQSTVNGVGGSNSVWQYGTIYSYDENSELTLNAIDNKTHIVRRTMPVGRNFSFKDTLSNLQFNTHYDYKSWVITTKDTIYSDIGSFCVKGGWKCDTEQNSVSRFGGVVGGEAYYMTAHGSTTKTICGFIPEIDGEKGNWLEEKFILGSIGELNTVSFVIDDTLYFGSWDASIDSTRLKKFIPSQEKKVEDVQIPESIDIYPGAVSFVIDGKAYMGWGINEKNSNYPYSNRFWEYDPANNGLIRDVTPDLISGRPKGRINAIAFVIGNAAYVGMGTWGLNLLTDMWKFIPPPSDNEKAIWQELPGSPFITPVGREAPVFFTIDNNGVSKGYLGGGKRNGMDRQDFWQFSPNTLRGDPWMKLEDVPSLPFLNTFGFGIDGRGYLGSWERNGSQFQTSFWKYTPDDHTCP